MPVHLRKNWWVVQQDIARLFETWMAFRRNGSLVQAVTQQSHAIEIARDKNAVSDNPDLSHNAVQRIAPLCNPPPTFLNALAGLICSGIHPHPRGPIISGVLMPKIMLPFFRSGPGGPLKHSKALSRVIIGPLPLCCSCREAVRWPHSFTAAPI